MLGKKNSPSPPRVTFQKQTSCFLLPKSLTHYVFLGIWHYRLQLFCLGFYKLRQELILISFKVDGHRKGTGKGIHPTAFLEPPNNQTCKYFEPKLFINRGRTICVSVFSQPSPHWGHPGAKVPEPLYPCGSSPYRAMANRMALSLSPWPRGSAGRAKISIR